MFPHLFNLEGSGLVSLENPLAWPYDAKDNCSVSDLLFSRESHWKAGWKACFLLTPLFLSRWKPFLINLRMSELQAQCLCSSSESGKWMASTPSAFHGRCSFSKGESTSVGDGEWQNLPQLRSSPEL